MTKHIDLFAEERQLLTRAAAAIKGILDAGGYDDDGDFYIRRQDGETPEADYLDAPCLVEARQTLAAIRRYKRQHGQRRRRRPLPA